MKAKNKQGKTALHQAARAGRMGAFVDVRNAWEEFDKQKQQVNLTTYQYQTSFPKY